MGVMLSFLVILFLWERGQNEGFSDYWLKDILIWKKGFCHCVFRKDDKALDIFQNYLDQK